MNEIKSRWWCHKLTVKYRNGSKNHHRVQLPRQPWLGYLVARTPFSPHSHHTTQVNLNHLRFSGAGAIMSGNYLRSLLLIRNLRFPDFYRVYDLIGSSPSLWLAPNPSKRWGELFFLFYTPFWLTLSLGIVVPYKLYEVSPPLFNTLPSLCNYKKRSIVYAAELGSLAPLYYTWTSSLYSLFLVKIRSTILYSQS